MNFWLGIILALCSMVSWGIGDFFIQRTSKLIGIWKALFCIAFTGAIVLLPFVLGDIRTFATNPDIIILLLITLCIVFFAALFDFEALREGKIAIVEPIISLELPITVGASIVLVHEHVSLVQAGLILVTFIGVMLAITAEPHHLKYHKRIFEKGIMWAGLGAIGMAFTNIFVGVSSQNTSPLFAIWFTHTGLALLTLFYLWRTKELASLRQDFKQHRSVIIGQSIFDNLAWIFFAFAVTYIPISIATTISEGYVALAALLGIIVNRERIKSHQALGITLTIIGVIILAAVSSS